QHVVLCGLNPEEILQLAQLLRLPGGEVVGLTEILVDFVKLPSNAVHIVSRELEFPGNSSAEGGGDPAIVVDGPVAEHLEILRRVATLGLRLIEGIDHAHAFDWLLGQAIYNGGRGDSGCLQNGWRDVDDVVELRAQAVLFLDALRPRYHQRVPRAA